MSEAFDVVVVGSGLSGLSTALAAAVNGQRVLVLEKGKKVGGASAYSGGQVWVAGNHVEAAQGIEDSIEEGEAYVRALSGERPDLLDEHVMHRWLSAGVEAAKWFEEIGAVRWSIIPRYCDYEYPAYPGSKEEGRYLSATFDARRLGEWRDRMLISPHFPVGETYDDLMTGGEGWRGLEDRGSHEGSGVTAFGVRDGKADLDGIPKADLLTMGPGVVGSFLHRLLQEPGVEIRTGHEVVELLTEDGRVVGVKARTGDGALVEARGAVVLATSGFDHDPALIREHWKLQEYVSMAPATLQGDGIRLAGAVGAAIDHIPGRYAPMVVGYRNADIGSGFVYAQEHSLPHTFIVDETGARFADDAAYSHLIEGALDPDDQHVPLFMIWDESHHANYGLGVTPPGGEYPDIVVSGATVGEVAEQLGIDPDGLQRTTAGFNEHAKFGEDPAFGRGTRYHWRIFGGDPKHPIHPNVAPVETAPFFGLRLTLGGTGVGMTGIRVDEEGRALDADRRPIEDLYAVGSAAVFSSSGSGYNSGFALGRAMTFGYLVAQQVAARTKAAQA